MWARILPIAIGYILARILYALGIGVVTYIGLEQLLSWVTDQIQGYIGMLPALTLNLMGMARLDIAINVILSAYSVNLGLMALKKFRVL